MQALLDQQCQAHENQARLQEQMAKKDEGHAREMEVLEKRPESMQAPPPGTQIVFNSRGNDPNDLFERFQKRCPQEFTGQEDPLAADDWFEHMENVFRCTGKQ